MSEPDPSSRGGIARQALWRIGLGLSHGDWHPSGPSVSDESKPAATGWVPVPDSRQRRAHATRAGSGRNWGQSPPARQRDTLGRKRRARAEAVPGVWRDR